MAEFRFQPQSKCREVERGLGASQPICGNVTNPQIWDRPLDKVKIYLLHLQISSHLLLLMVQPSLSYSSQLFWGKCTSTYRKKSQKWKTKAFRSQEVIVWVASQSWPCFFLFTKYLPYHILIHLFNSNS